MEEFGFDKFQNPALEVPKERKKMINFQEIPKEKEVQPISEKDLQEKYGKEESISMPSEDNPNQTHLSLILSPNLKDLELMIRGLEYKKRYNPITKRDEVILCKIPNHPLNEYGVNKIMEFLRIYVSPEIKLGRKTPKESCDSVQQVGRDATRLIYKNLKSFGMDTQEKQRSAKTYVLAIVEFVHAAFSRSINGLENDSSRPTEFTVQGSTDLIDNPNRVYNKKMKEQLKN